MSVGDFSIAASPAASFPDLICRHYGIRSRHRSGNASPTPNEIRGAQTETDETTLHCLALSGCRFNSFLCRLGTVWPAWVTPSRSGARAASRFPPLPARNDWGENSPNASAHWPPEPAGQVPKIWESQRWEMARGKNIFGFPKSLGVRGEPPSPSSGMHWDHGPQRGSGTVLPACASPNRQDALFHYAVHGEISQNASPHWPPEPAGQVPKIWESQRCEMAWEKTSLAFPNLWGFMGASDCIFPAEDSSNPGSLPILIPPTAILPHPCRR